MHEEERRPKIRLPIALGVRFITRRPPVFGAGRTVNLSSSGVLIASQYAMTVGAKIELFIDWPYRLNKTTPLQFVARGRVVRLDNGVFAVSLQHYEFRTMKKRPQSVSATAYGDVPPPQDKLG